MNFRKARLTHPTTYRKMRIADGDVHAFLNAGLLDKTEDGKIVFPYDAIHVDFIVKAA